MARLQSIVMTISLCGSVQVQWKISTFINLHIESIGFTRFTCVHCVENIILQHSYCQSKLN